MDTVVTVGHPKIVTHLEMEGGKVLVHYLDGGPIELDVEPWAGTYEEAGNTVQHLTYGKIAADPRALSAWLYIQQHPEYWGDWPAVSRNAREL